MDHNINSGEDYARLLTETISQADGPLPEQLVEYWCEDIWEMAVNSYNDYIAGKKDDYGLLKPLPTPGNYIEAEMALLKLQDSNIKVTLTKTLQGPSLMVFERDYEIALAVLKS
jgi:hypothetical protein